MTYFADLSLCTYFPFEPENKLFAVGWLEAEHPYHQGHVLDGFLKKFLHLNEHWWEPCPFDGWHDCSFCPPDRTSWSGRRPETASFRNVFVPGLDCLYVAPEILSHYVKRHGYAPPEEFQHAVLACPDSENSRKEYLRLVFDKGPPSLGRFVEERSRYRVS